MRILVATDGHMDAEATTDLVVRLLEPGDSVTVLTVIDHPGEVLRSFADMGAMNDVEQILGDTGPGSLGFGSGTSTAEHLKQRSKAQKGQAQPLDKYFTDTANRLQKDLLERLQAKNVEAEAIWCPTEKKTARTILEATEHEKADLLIIGSHGVGRFEGRLGSTVTKLVRMSEIPVLLVRQ